MTFKDLIEKTACHYESELFVVNSIKYLMDDISTVEGPFQASETGRSYASRLTSSNLKELGRASEIAQKGSLHETDIFKMCVKTL